MAIDYTYRIQLPHRTGSSSAHQELSRTDRTERTSRAVEEVVWEVGAQAVSKREGRLITPWKPYRAPATA
jgi:hypothetical protein